MTFDRVAPLYRTLETIMFGNALQRARVRWIGELPHPQRALIVGEGNGRFICELIRAHPGLKIDCVEASAVMVALAERRLYAECPDAQVRFFQHDIFNWRPSSSYDLLVTHFFLDCFPAAEIETVVEKLARTASPGATWLLADFRVPSERWARLRDKLWLQTMYTFFRLTAGLSNRELIDATPYLSRHDFVCRARELSRGGMLKSEMWMRLR